MKVITTSVVPPEGVLLGEKALETRGRLGVTESKSAAVQVPPTHAGFVFVTPDGGEMETVLVTPVCACKSAEPNVKPKEKMIKAQTLIMISQRKHPSR